MSGELLFRGCDPPQAPLAVQLVAPVEDQVSELVPVDAAISVGDTATVTVGG
jgi:hypothetical protein